jgi:integrase/recombinase XerD
MKDGELGRWLGKYLTVRKGIGYPPHNYERLLRGFVSFVGHRERTNSALARLAVEWALGTSTNPRTRVQRLSIARGFLAHLGAQSRGVQVPPLGALGGAPRPSPYIFTDAEIKAIVTAARSLGPAGTLRPHTYSTILGLLASSGMRVGEVVKLQLDDAEIDARSAHLRVVNTKFHKSRLVALHPTTAAALKEYRRQRGRLGYQGGCKYFFISERLGPVSGRSVRRILAQIVGQLGIGHERRRPHPHDLRHTFAVRRMLAWYREGADVRARLPELSVYMGHVNPTGTFWYLSAVPELLSMAGDRFARFAKGGQEP